MPRAGRNIAAISGPVCRASAIDRQRHLAFENDVRSLHGMGVIGVTLVRAVFPKIRVAKSFAMQLFFEIGNIHRSTY